MRPARIALCLEYPIALRGGVSVLVESLIEELAGDFEIVLVSGDAHVSGGIAERIAGHVCWSAERGCSRQLVRELSGLGVKMVHFHGGGVYTWGVRRFWKSPVFRAARSGMRTLLTTHLVVDPFHGLCRPDRPQWLKACLLVPAWLSRLVILHGLDAEIAVSRHDQSLLRRWYPPVAGKIRQLYHSRISETPSAEATRDETIVAVGHIAFRKGQQILAEAFSRVAAEFPRWKLALAGEILEEGCAEEIRRHGAASGRIELLGERADAMALMERCGVFVQPSLHEALGLALQEALFLGNACIGTRAGGIPELIDDGRTGLLVPKADAPALAQALVRLMNDPKLRETLGAAGRRDIVARGMTRRQMGEQHRKIYRELLRDQTSVP